MKKIILLALITISITSCKKESYACYICTHPSYSTKEICNTTQDEIDRWVQTSGYTCTRK